MEAENLTSLDKFLIVGFSDFPEQKASIFAAFILIYLATMAGNIIIISTVYSNSSLHTPMYFFLTHLSFIDMSSTSIIFPKLLAQFFRNGTYIPLSECLLQMYFFSSMMCTECLLLSIMAYDRYIAICNPLHYMNIMSEPLCIWLALGSWLIGLLYPIPHIVLISKLFFCGSHTIKHFFCDAVALIKLSCSSTSSVEVLTFVIGSILIILSFILIIASYINIISAILKIQSVAGQRKAFSTCASHITVVILFNGSLGCTYMRPTSTYSMKESKILSLVYIAATPLCNPIIYSLKNTDFIKALRNMKSTV